MSWNSMTELTINQALQQAIEAHKAGQVQEADRLYTAILKAQPQHADANHNMGVLAVGVGKVEQALPFFKTALTANAATAQFWLSYIDALIKLNKLADAKAVLDQAKSKGAKGEEFERLVKQLNHSGGAIIQPIFDIDKSDHDQLNILNTLKLDQALKLASKKFKAGSSEDAKMIYNEILAKFPRNKKANNGLKALLDKPFKKEAKVRKLQQEKINQLKNLYDQGQLLAVVDLAHRLTLEYPNAFIIWNYLGAARAQIGQLDTARQALKKVTQLNPNFADGHNNYGNCLKELGNQEEAIQAYSKAAAINPYYAEAHYNMGTIFQDKGELEAAIDAYSKALAINPDYASAFYNIGLAFQAQGNLSKAVEAYKKAIALEPKHVAAQANMGVALQKQGKLEEAIEAYNRALRINPNYAETKLNLISILTNCVPKKEYLTGVASVDNFIRNIDFGSNRTGSISDEIILGSVSEALTYVKNFDPSLRIEESQVYRRNSDDLNCSRHMEIFKNSNIIPQYCFGCYKVQVEPNSLIELIKLSLVFDKIKLDRENIRKCMVEVRPAVSGFYKGLIYCNGLDEARQISQTLDPILHKKIRSGLNSKVKRGCSEYAITFPEYNKITEANPQPMHYDESWKVIENEHDSINFKSITDKPLPTISGVSLKDVLIIQKWIDYAKAIGDPSYRRLKQDTIHYQGFYNLAKARLSRFPY